jgi:hypothetical protein
MFLLFSNVTMCNNVMLRQKHLHRIQEVSPLFLIVRLLGSGADVSTISNTTIGSDVLLRQEHLHRIQEVSPLFLIVWLLRSGEDVSTMYLVTQRCAPMRCLGRNICT